MIVSGSANPLLLGQSSGYNLTRSLRFRASASAYLNRTPASVGNRQTFTISAWVKRGALGSTQYLFGTYLSTGVDEFNFNFNSADTLWIGDYQSADNILLKTTQVFRDPSAWYHLVLAIDTTQATASNRVKLYVNGSQITSFSTATYPSQNYNTTVWNASSPSAVGARGRVYTNNLDGYLAEYNFIDGQQLTPSSFGSTNATTGVWQPARYTGTYGTNGFYLPFTDNSALTTSSNVGLGKDFSGNGNYWTTNNISITTGVTYDSMTDVPTLTSATAANFAVLNPLSYDTGTYTISNANLNFAGSRTATGAYFLRSTIAMTSGKYYWEITPTDVGAGPNIIIGIQDATVSVTSGTSGFLLNGYGYYAGGTKYTSGSSAAAYGASWTNGDVIGIAFDATAGTLTFYKNNTSQGTAFTGITGSYVPVISMDVGGVARTIAGSINCGQQPFTYTPPTGYVALNCYNIPTSTILAGNKVMDATLWTGNSTGSSTQVITNAGGFKPDFVWAKSRSAAYDHNLVDSVRGASKILYSDLTNAEVTNANGLASFNSNGFTLGTDAGGFNDSGKTYVGWQWQAGQGTTSSNTNGSITSTVSVNASAGFSVVTFSTSAVYTGGTVGHGLGIAPAMYIVKNRNGVANINWITYHQSVGNTAALYLNGTNAATTSSTFWNNTSPTSSVFSIGANLYISSDMVAYCWTPIAGYSAFGSYTGNGSADGPMVYTGFRPKFILWKRTDSTADWTIFDSARDTYNVAGPYLNPNTSGAETSDSTVLMDLLSNGFKIRGTWQGMNASGGTFIYAAFAENPFKNALAR